jgi:trigger factor
MRATSEVVENNRVKLTVEVEESEIDSALDDVVRSISRQARIPGFRPGRVPRKVLEARMGGAVALRAEALREALPDFYAQAVSQTEIDPIASPEIDITGGEESGPVSFDALVEVRPSISVAGYEGLQATIPSPLVAESEIDAQIDRLRDNDGEFVDVERPVLSGDFVTLDLTGTNESGEQVASADDYLYEVGSGVVVAELDGALPGTKAGDELEVVGTPSGGTPITFAVKVVAVREKRLPEVTDEWAAEASEFTTVEELKNDLSERIGQVKLVQAQMALREASLAALAELVDESEVPESLIDAEVNERLHDLSHRLEAQKISVDQFLAVTGQSGDDLIAGLRSDAQRAVKVDLALRALALAEGIELSDEELADELVTMAEQVGTTPTELRDQLDRAGRTGSLRAERVKAKAATWLLEHIDVVDEEGQAVDRSLLDANLADDHDHDHDHDHADDGAQAESKEDE